MDEELKGDIKLLCAAIVFRLMFVITGYMLTGRFVTVIEWVRKAIEIDCPGALVLVLMPYAVIVWAAACFIDYARKVKQ